MATTGSDASIYQTVLIPANAPYLRFSYRISGARSCDSGIGEDYIWVYPDSLSAEWVLDTCNTAGWVTGTLDLTSVAGSTQQIVIQVTTAVHGGTVFFDDVGFVSGPTREVDYY